MRESSHDLYIKGSYLKNNPDWEKQDSYWKAMMIYELYKKNNIAPTKVVETGCGTGGVLQELSKKDTLIETLEGFDISPQAISIANENENEKVKFYNEDFILRQDFQCDLLLVIDVLEHVDNYYDFLKELNGKSSYYIFHIPLDLSCRTILKPHVLLQQRQSVGHIHYFSEEIIRWDLTDAGFQIIDWNYTKPVIDRNRSESFKSSVKKILRNISFNISRSVSVKLWGNYSMLILAKSTTGKV